MTNKEAVEILKQMRAEIANDRKWLALDRAIKALEDRPQSKYDFLEILAHYVPDEICTYPEYRGKPYYSIHFRENGEDYAGFGTYNPEVLSRYLREYFFAYPGGGQADGKGGSET